MARLDHIHPLGAVFATLFGAKFLGAGAFDVGAVPTFMFSHLTSNL